MTLLGPTPAAVIGVVHDVVNALAPARAVAADARQRLDLRVLPARRRRAVRGARRPGVLDDDRGCFVARGASSSSSRRTSLNFLLIAARHRGRRRRSRVRRSFAGVYLPLLPVEFADGPAHRRRRLRLPAAATSPRRPVRRRRARLPVPARRRCSSRRSASERARAPHHAARRLQVGLLSALLRTLDLRDQMTARHCAAVARYSREIAARAGLSRARAGARPHRRRCCTTSASSSSPTDPQGRRASSPTRTGRSSSATPSRAPGSSRRSTATARSPRSSSPTTSASTARATRAASRATRSRCCRGSSPSPTPTT